MLASRVDTSSRKTPSLCLDIAVEESILQDSNEWGSGSQRKEMFFQETVEEFVSVGF